MQLRRARRLRPAPSPAVTRPSTSTRQAIAFSFLDRYARPIIHIGWSMVLARIMKPAEIGIYLMVMLLLGFYKCKPDSR